jgi:hypothetical protein
MISWSLRERVQDPCHHDVVQPSPISGWINNVGEDVVVQGVSMKHKVTPPLVVGRHMFQNDRDHRSYVLNAGSLRVQVHGEGGIGVGTDVDGVVVIIVLGDNDPLGSGELLFQVMSDDLLLLPSDGGSTLMHMGLIQGLAYNSHDGDESLLLSLRGSHGRGVVLPLSSGGGLLLIDREVGGAARHGRQDDGG